MLNLIAVIVVRSVVKCYFFSQWHANKVKGSIQNRHGQLTADNCITATVSFYEPGSMKFSERFIHFKT